MGFIVALVFATVVLILVCYNKEDPSFKKEGVYEQHMDALRMLYRASEREVFVAAIFREDPDDRRGRWFDKLDPADQDRVIDRYADTLQARRIHVDPEQRERLLTAWRILRGKEEPWTV